MSNPCENCGACCTIFTLMDVKEKADYFKNGYTKDYQISERNARVLKWIEEDIEEIKHQDIIHFDVIDIREMLYYNVSLGFIMLWYKKRKVQHFRCKLYDPVAQKCTDYENRPYVCVGFPYESMIPFGHHVYKECNLFDLISEEMTQ